MGTWWEVDNHIEEIKCPYCGHVKDIIFDDYEGCNQQDGCERTYYCPKCDEESEMLIGWHIEHWSKTRKRSKEHND